MHGGRQAARARRDGDARAEDARRGESPAIKRGRLAAALEDRRYPLDALLFDCANLFAADRFTVADKIEHLLEAIPIGGKVRFETLFSDAASRVEVIVTFLALLELMKLNQLMIEQEQMLGEIIVIRASGN